MTKADNTYKEILELVHKLQEEITELRKENSTLKLRIRELENTKNSNNSSIPPSKDDNRIKKNQSLRSSSGKKSGGQPGHKGHTLKMAANPDRVIEHMPDTCESCGNNLSSINPNILEKRQVVELPPIKPLYIEHRSYAKICSCGCLNKSKFPKTVNAPMQYGNSVENLVAYLNVGQYLPYNRIASMLKGVFNIQLSEGTIQNMLERFANKAKPFYQQLRNEIETADIVGADETGAKVNGEKWWFWTWQNKSSTYITASNNRAFKTIESHFPNGFPNATLISDRYSAHLKTKANAHQICISHLFRDLNYLIELTSSSVIKRLKGLLKHAIFLKSQLKLHEYEQTNLVRNYIMRNVFYLLKAEHCNEHKKVRALLKKLYKSKEHIFEFLYSEHIPPDNNSSERAIRNVKVKQKVSTMFKSEIGITNYAIIRSVLDTCLKRNIPMLQACKIIS